MIVLFGQTAVQRAKVTGVAERVFDRHPSPQPLLSGPGDVEWRPAMQLRPYAARRGRRGIGDQLPRGEKRRPADWIGSQANRTKGW